MLRFSSGICGVAVVVFALMGSVGVGYLLNGESGYATVNDYTYVTDVSGLYDYESVAQYSDYSPAQNNYQYSTTLENLGRYTSGINFTKSDAANLNPIITPTTGETTQSEIAYMGSLNKTQLMATFDYRTTSTSTTTSTITVGSCYYLTLQSLIEQLEPFSKELIISTPINEISNSAASLYFLPMQQIGILSMTATSLSECIDKGATAYLRQNGFIQACPADADGTNVSVVGTITGITVNANGTATYGYTYNGTTTTYTVDPKTTYIHLYILDPYPSGGGEDYIRYTYTSYTNVEYLDVNYGVSLSGPEAYWSNDSSLGSVSWMFKKSGAASESFTCYDSNNNAINTWKVRYDSSWKVDYTDSTGTAKTYDVGSGWDAIQVKEFYTGQLQISPVRTFNNFTSYELGNTVTIGMQNTGGSEPIAYYLTVRNNGDQVFAVVGTSVNTGTVLGAMQDATFTVANYFPDLNAIRLSFDSSAYIGTGVTVSDWTMAVDFNTYTGTFTTAGGASYTVDMTQPWSLTWNLNGGLDITFTRSGFGGETTIEVMGTAPAKVVTLNGQWVIDTDLYEVGTHLEEVYDWNFGSWGLDSSTFIVTAMGLTALIAIAFKLARVPMGALDFVIIFAGNAILWLIL